MKRLLPILQAAVLSYLLGTGGAAQAQNPAMSLIGSVQSIERQPLQGAAITVIHLPSGVRHATASDAAGRFVVSNLMVGGPYIIQVGEGGYQPQTVENIFLENGKTATFAVTLDKLGMSSGKDRANRITQAVEPKLALASEATIGGPVLITTVSAPAKPATAASMPAPANRPAGQPLPAPAPATTQTVAAPTAATPVAAAPAATTGAAAPAVATGAAPARYRRNNRYPARQSSSRVTDPIVPGHFDAKTGNYLYETGQPTTLKLANGNSINDVGINSTESYLYRFLTNPQMEVDTLELTRGWYNFDRVFFEPGKASLTSTSLNQLRNIATLLRAYPNARIKLGGYTDDTGTYAVNRQLSEARARTAWASLVDMGVSPSRMDARGYGSYYSIASNSTEEGRAKNRRLSLRVLQK